MKIRNKLCLADSGLPLCLVVRALKLQQFEVAILLGVSRHLPPPSSPDADRILVGLMGPPFQFNPVHINKNLIQFPQCRYASETIDSWCLQCYLIRHAPLKVKFKKFSGQYWLPCPTIMQLSSYLKGWFQSKSVLNNAQWAVALS